MNPRPVTRLSVFPLLAALAGCGSNTSSSLSTTANKTPAAYANWEFRITDPGPGGIPPLADFRGAIQEQGTAVTATMRATGNSNCVAPAFDIQFTGTVDAQGDLTLNSTNVPGNVITLTGATVQNNSLPGTPTTLGSLTISGSGACAFPGGVTALVGNSYHAFTGAYSGSLTSNVGGTASATLTQASANTDGQFPETGVFTLGSAGCSATFSLNGLVSGSGLNASMTSASNASASAQLTGVIKDSNADGVTISLAVAGTGCADGNYTGTLAAQSQ